MDYYYSETSITGHLEFRTGFVQSRRNGYTLSHGVSSLIRTSGRRSAVIFYTSHTSETGQLNQVSYGRNKGFLRELHFYLINQSWSNQTKKYWSKNKTFSFQALTQDEILKSKQINLNDYFQTKWMLVKLLWIKKINNILTRICLMTSNF